MTDSIVRFTDDELLEITVGAAPLIDARIWCRLDRDTGADFDRVIIWLVREDVNHYRLERDQMGLTHLLWCTSCDWRLVVSGTVADCLSMFSRRWQ